jgi:DNA-directed RNA polymerase specialized sigma54-like protein
VEAAHHEKRRVSISGMLQKLGVSRTGYRSWINRRPSKTQKRQEEIKTKIESIYNNSKQNYGAPKIAKKLKQSGEIISERTVGKYMKEMGIKAQW